MAAIRTIHRTSTHPPSTFRHLQIHQRTNICHHAYSRSFSSTVVRKNELADLVSGPPLFLLETLHAAHIPWWATIPIAAVLVRGILGYHLGGKQAHQRQKMRVAMDPVITATAMVETRVFTHELRNRRDSLALEKRKKSLEFARERFGTWYTFGALPFGLWSLGNFALLITTAEAIRLKIGAKAGLLSIVLSPVQEYVVKPLPLLISKVLDFVQHPNATFTSTGTSPETDAPVKVESMSQGVVDESTPQVVMSLEEVVDSVSVPTDLPSEAELSAYDPTTTFEGLSFCTDLTGPDASGILPATLFVVMVVSTILRPSRAAHASSIKNWLKSFQATDGFLILVAYVFWQFVTDLPAGIYLYLIASMIVGKMQTIWLNVMDTIPSPVKACARAPNKVPLPFSAR